MKLKLGRFSPPAHLLSFASSTAIAFAGNGMMMAMSAVSGIYIVRFISTGEYAIYTIAITAYLTINQIADGGISAATANEARKNWQSGSHIAAAIASGRNVRQRALPLIMAVSSLVLMYILFVHGLSWGVALMITAMILSLSLIAMETGLMNVPFYLHQKMGWLQSSILSAESIKILGAFCVIQFLPFSGTCLAVLLVALSLQLFLLKKGMKRLHPLRAAPDNEMKLSIKEIRGNLRPLIIYTCFSGYLSVWLASIFGATADIASVGGITRITTLQTVGITLFGLVVAPRYSRTLDIGLLRKRFVISFLVLLSIVGIALAPSMFFPELLLKLLGGDYSHLEEELRIASLGSGLGGIYAGLHALALGRGSLVKPWTYLAVVISWQIILLSIFNLRTLQGILWTSALAPIPSIIAYLISSIRGILKEEKMYQQASASNQA